MSTAQSNREDYHTELKVFLLRRGISQRQLARQLGVTIAYLNHVLRGRKPGHALRKRLVEEIGIPSDLVAYTPDQATHAA